jgi:predicted PurR-regulated permease PerM
MASEPLPPLDEKLERESSRGPVLAARRETERDETRKSLGTVAGAQIVIALGVVVAICYFAKLPLITILAAMLITFVLDPLVQLLERIRIPRGWGSALAILLMLGVLYGLSYFFYARAVDFMQELPRVTGKVRQTIGKYQRDTQKIRQSTQQIVPENKDEKNAVRVKVQQDTGFTSMVRENVGPVAEVLAAVSFIPFLVFFMLTWQEHARSATVKLFKPENRTTAYVTIGKISEMMRSFIAGNFVVGLFMSVVSAVVFAFLKLDYFYFVGFISGFLSLVPYLGVILAILPPLALGMGHLHSGGIIIIAVTVLGLHVFAMNVLYPKFIGRRLQLNPLLVTLSLLVWGWIWGAMGLILAVPIMGAIKIICDHIESLRPLGEWMGE